MASKDPGNSAGELFPIEEVAPLIEGRETDTSTVDRAQHMVEALNYFDTVATLETDIRKFNNPEWLKEQEARLGKNITYKWRRQKHEKHQAMLDKAKEEFMLAYTPQELVHGGLTEEEAHDELERRYGIFEQAYRGTSQGRHQKRQQVRAEYEQYIGTQGVEQELLEEKQIVEAPTFPVENPDAKVSLARALRPEFARLNPAEYEDITREDILNLHPNFLAQSLVGVAPKTKNARYHLDEVQRKRNYTVFVPGEWKTLLRTSPEFVAEAAFNHVETAQRKLPVEERDSLASTRAEVHANRGYSERMQAYMAEDLDIALDVIARFKEAAQFNGGLARFGNEANMRAQMEFFWGSIVGDMLWAARIANEVDPQWEEQAMRTLEKRVYFAGSPAARLACFGMICDVAETWIQARKDHMLAKSFEAESYADKKEKEIGFRIGQNLPLSS